MNSNTRRLSPDDALEEARSKLFFAPGYKMPADDPDSELYWTEEDYADEDHLKPARISGQYDVYAEPQNEQSNK